MALAGPLSSWDSCVAQSAQVQQPAHDYCKEKEKKRGRKRKKRSKDWDRPRASKLFKDRLAMSSPSATCWGKDNKTWTGLRARAWGRRNASGDLLEQNSDACRGINSGHIASLCRTGGWPYPSFCSWMENNENIHSWMWYRTEIFAWYQI